jgi:hypothetical protein
MVFIFILKDYKIGICCISAKHAAGVRTKTGCFRIRIMCQCGVICLPVDCYFSKIMMSDLYYTNATSYFFIVRPLKQQSTGRHITPHRHILLILKQPVFVLTPAACLAEMQQTPILWKMPFRTQVYKTMLSKCVNWACFI